MIDFQRLDLAEKARFDEILMNCGQRGCEYTFVNLFLWGRQKAAFVNDRLLIQSQFDRKCVYPLPMGPGDLKMALDAIIADARERGIPCCLTSLKPEECEIIEELYPGSFSFHMARDNFDYVYDINGLADLKGRKYQKKRNHLNNFRKANPDIAFVPMDDVDPKELETMLEQWYTRHLETNPDMDYHLEQVAIGRAMKFRRELGMEGLVLLVEGKIAAFAMGSRMNEDTFDIHFEKALDESAYPAINQGFAAHLREKYPELKWLDREDDMGLEGLRKAKLSYNPDMMIEKYWARLWEDEDVRNVCK
ncbi:MAG: DUF2156 domain-containing protein [Oscillospiraceae bacterium]|nr:DUF2156 domain-containing protein [Oscillospiraceae bacterium]